MGLFKYYQIHKYSRLTPRKSDQHKKKKKKSLLHTYKENVDNPMLPSYSYESLDSFNFLKLPEANPVLPSD